MPTTRSRKLTVARPAFDDATWRTAHTSRRYTVPGTTYEDYAPAYRYGVLVADKHGHKAFTEVEPLLAAEWVTVRGASRLDWEKARPAVEDGYAGLLRVQPVRTARRERSAKPRTGHRKSRSAKPAGTSRSRTTSRGRTHDDRTKRGPQDRSRINIHEAWEVRYWSKKLGVTPAELRRAVKKSGPLAKNVQRELRRS